MGEANVKDEQFLELFRKSRRDVAVSKELTGLEQMWADKARANYERAGKLAAEARGLARGKWRGRRRGPAPGACMHSP